MVMDTYIVEMKNITKHFPGIVANDKVTIQIRKGEIYALLGENGAGKSTLMSILFGMYEPDEGEIAIRGEKVILKSSNDAAALNIGMVHQHFKLVQNYTVTQNIVLGIEPVKRIFGIIPFLSLKATSKRIRALSQSYGLEVDPEACISDLAVSAQQRVEILKMLYRDAEILIFDEPTAVLTPQEIEYLMKIMRGLKSAGKTIILITHKLEEIKKIADRCAILLRGKLVGVYNVQEISTKEMASLMVGRNVDLSITKNRCKNGKVILEVKNLTVISDEKIELVKKVTFSIKAGEIFAIAGVSGNGQVEIADAIIGLLESKCGEIIFKGKNITHCSIRERIEHGISYIPEDRQKFGVVLDFSLQSNLALKLYYKPPFSRKGILHIAAFEEHANRLIGKYDIRSGQGKDTSLRSMSGGNQQKAIIAREVEMASSLLIFVQPTRGLDIGATDNIRRQIIAERDSGKAVLLITLDLDEVMTLADTIGVIYNGELLKIAAANTLATEEVGSYMMGVKH